MNSINRLEELLKTHDWWHMMSDDHNVWGKGNRSAKEIERLVAENKGFGRYIYNKYAPKEFQNDKYDPRQF
jgi:hypothetical protein